MGAEANPPAGSLLEAVSLDVMGTLVGLEPPAPRLRSALAELAGVHVSEAQASVAFRAEIAYYMVHHLEGADAASLERLTDDCAEVIRSRLGVPRESSGGVRAAMLSAISFHAHPDAAPALDELRARGVRLVAVSNWDCSLPEVLGRVGLGAKLDAVTSSAGVGRAKPDPDPFRAALEAVGVAPARAVHVGDSVGEDVEGARAAGLRPVLLRRDGGGVERERTPPNVEVIAGLDELAPLLWDPE